MLDRIGVCRDELDRPTPECFSAAAIGLRDLAFERHTRENPPFAQNSRAPEILAYRPADIFSGCQSWLRMRLLATAVMGRSALVNPSWATPSRQGSPRDR